jgi:hypothetical protein
MQYSEVSEKAEIFEPVIHADRGKSSAMINGPAIAAEIEDILIFVCMILSNLQQRTGSRHMNKIKA